MSREKQESHKDYFSEVFSNSVFITYSQQVEANEGLGVTQVYNKDTRREIFDDLRQRNEFKDDVFATKKTAKAITGENVHKSHNAAKNQHKGNWTRNASETDHIVSLKRGHSRLKHNPFLSDEDARSILNDKRYNLREVDKHFNTVKKEKCDLNPELFGELPTEGKIQAVKENIKAEAGIFTKTTVITTKNVGKEFAQGATEALEVAAIPIMIEGVRNLMLVANGEKNFQDAAKDMGKVTTKIAVSGGGMKVVTTGVTNALKTSSNELLKSIAKSNYVGQIITVSVILTQSLGRYINGDISGEEFFKEIGEQGVGLVAGAVGAAVGQLLIPIPYVGAIIGSLIISTACMGIYRAYTSINAHKEKLSQVNTLAAQALGEMERQRNILKDMIGEQFSKWDEQFNTGFEEIYQSTLNNDVNGIAKGLDRLLKVFNGSVRFKTIEEFDEFFMDENATLSF